MSESTVKISIYQTDQGTIIKIASMDCCHPPITLPSGEVYVSEYHPDIYYTFIEHPNAMTIPFLEITKDFQKEVKNFFGEEEALFSTTIYHEVCCPYYKTKVNGESEENINELIRSGDIVQSAYTLLLELGFPGRYPRIEVMNKDTLDEYYHPDPKTLKEFIYYLSRVKFREMRKRPETKEYRSTREDTQIHDIWNKKKITISLTLLASFSFGVVLLSLPEKIDFNSHYLRNHYHLFSSTLGGCLISVSIILLLFACCCYRPKLIRPILKEKIQPVPSLLPSR